MSHPRNPAPSSARTPLISQSQTIRIRELCQLPPTPLGARKWTVRITSGSYNITRTLVDPFNATSETRLRWALEEHPQNSPFEDQKAAEISQELWGYSMSLMEQLRLIEIISSLSKPKKKKMSEEGVTLEASMQGINGKKWFVDIEGWDWNSLEGTQEACMNGIHWEALENPDVWPTQIRPCIIVRRRVPSADIVTGVPIVGVGNGTFRILLVVSHPMFVVTSGRKTASPRLVTRPLVDLVERVKAECGTPVYLEVLRPAGWSALEKKLSQSGKGFWHLVHFDVNARVTKIPQKSTTDQKTPADDEVSLSFVSERCPQKRIWKTAQEISSLLVSNGIKFVILNAPRTAKSFGAVSSNFAEALVQDGIRAVVALPNKILNAGAEVLMSTFYRCFLAETWDLAVAVSEARRAMMRVKKREGQFGVMIPIDDWIVPVLYHNGATEVCVIGNDLGTNFTATTRNTVPDPKGFLSKFQGLLSCDHTRSPDTIIAGKGPTRHEEVPGREYDIFKIDQLLDNNILHLTGVPGVGKTKLVAHLGWWWKATSLVEDSFYFDYDKQPSLTPEMLLSKIYFQLFTTAPIGTHRKSNRTTSPRPPIAGTRGNFLTQWSVSASSRSSSPTSDTSDGAGDESWIEKTLDRLNERPYLIVLDSLESSEAEIKDDEVLRGEVNEFLKMLQGGKSVVVVVGNKKESWLNDSLVRFGAYHLNRLDVGQAIDLAGSILEKYGGDRKRFQNAENKHYLEMLLQLCDFNPLVMELTLPRVAQGPLAPLETLLDTLQSQTTLTYAPSIKPLRNLSSLLSRLDKGSKQLLLCLAPFRTRLPKDINPYLHCLLYRNALPTTADASTMQFLLSRPPSIQENERVTAILSSTGLLARYSISTHY